MTFGTSSGSLVREKAQKPELKDTEVGGRGPHRCEALNIVFV